AAAPAGNRAGRGWQPLASALQSPPCRGAWPRPSRGEIVYPCISDPDGEDEEVKRPPP
ncbi:hypothetical protein B296_00041421, partial [Ensete ventricosum]